MWGKMAGSWREEAGNNTREEGEGKEEKAEGEKVHEESWAKEKKSMKIVREIDWLERDLWGNGRESRGMGNEGLSRAEPRRSQ